MSGSLGVSQTENRRQQSRRKVKLQKIFAAEFAEPQSGSCFLHIYDLSEQGMRVHTDHHFETDRLTHIKLFLDNPIEVGVRSAWTKELFGGMYVTGLAFENLSQEAQIELANFMERYSPDSKRRSVRIQRILPVEIQLGSLVQKMSVFTLDISTTGMRINHDYPLPEDIDIPFSILIDLEQDPLEVVSRVSWQEENTLGQYVIGLQFQNPNNEVLCRLEEFMAQSNDYTR